MGYSTAEDQQQLYLYQAAARSNKRSERTWPQLGLRAIALPRTLKSGIRSVITADGTAAIAAIFKPRLRGFCRFLFWNTSDGVKYVHQLSRPSVKGAARSHQASYYAKSNKTAELSLVSHSNISKYSLTTHIRAELEDGGRRNGFRYLFRRGIQSKQTLKSPKSGEIWENASAVFNADIQLEAFVQRDFM